MAPPSKIFTVIPDADVDPDSPVSTGLMTALRDNDIHLEEWLGLSYTAAQDHNHDGTNSATIGAIQNSGIQGGRWSGHWGQGSTGSTAYQTVVSVRTFVPSGVPYVRSTIYIRANNAAATCDARMVIIGAAGSATGNVVSQTGTTWVMKELYVAGPTSSPPGGPQADSWYTVGVQAKVSNALYLAEVEDDGTGSTTDVREVKYFSHLSTGGI